MWPTADQPDSVRLRLSDERGADSQLEMAPLEMGCPKMLRSNGTKCLCWGKGSFCVGRQQRAKGALWMQGVGWGT
jgi:hypothetical protein